MRRWLPALAALALPGAGCLSLVREARGGEILAELSRSHAGDLLWQGFLWGTVGGLLGLGLAVGVYFGLARLGAYRLEWRHARWLRGLTFALLLVAAPALVGVAGCAQGLLRGAATVLRESRLGTDLLPIAGRVGADLVAGCYFIAPSLRGEAQPSWPEAEMAEFAAGTRRVDVGDLGRRLDGVSLDVATRLAGDLKGRLLVARPALRGGLPERLLDSLLPRLAQRLVNREVAKRLERFGVDDVVDEIAREARRHGDGKTLDREQLTRLIVDHVFVPALLWPLRQVVRPLQRSMGIGLLLVILVPVAGFRLAEALRRRRRKDPPGEAPAA